MDCNSRRLKSPANRDYRSRVPLLLAALGVVLAAAACAERSPPELFGTYTLRVINDSRLPATILFSDAVEIAVAGSDVVLRSDSTFVHATRYRIDARGEISSQSDTVRGSFSLVGDKVLATPIHGITYVLVWEGAGLVHYAEGLTYRYRK